MSSIVHYHARPSVSEALAYDSGAFVPPSFTIATEDGELRIKVDYNATGQLYWLPADAGGVASVSKDWRWPMGRFKVTGSIASGYYWELAIFSGAGTDCLALTVDCQSNTTFNLILAEKATSTYADRITSTTLTKGVWYKFRVTTNTDGDYVLEVGLDDGMLVEQGTYSGGLYQADRFTFACAGQSIAVEHWFFETALVEGDNGTDRKDPIIESTRLDPSGNLGGTEDEMGDDADCGSTDCVYTDWQLSGDAMATGTYSCQSQAEGDKTQVMQMEAAPDSWDDEWVVVALDVRTWAKGTAVAKEVFYRARIKADGGTPVAENSSYSLTVLSTPWQGEVIRIAAPPNGVWQNYTYRSPAGVATFNHASAARNLNGTGGIGLYGDISDPEWEVANAQVANLWVEVIALRSDPVVDDALRLPGWSHRRTITLDEAANSVINYEARIALSSSNFDFSVAKSDGSDIRFATLQNEILDYWIESYDNGAETAVVWVRVPFIPIGGIQIYLYYGNSGAAAMADGHLTFHFFDDFTLGWEEDPANPIVEVGGTGTWDDAKVADPVVHKDGSTYHMWYHGEPDGSFQSQIGHATASSPEGPWTKDVANPIITFGTYWDSFALTRPSVVEKDGTWYLFYSALGHVAPWSVELATASSPDGPWTKSASAPLMVADKVYEGELVRNPSVLYDDEEGIWKMWYSAEGIGGEGRIWCYATSPEAVGPWTKWPGNPIAEPPEDGSYLGSGLNGIHMQKYDGRYVMAHNAMDAPHDEGGTSRAGLASSHNGSTWRPDAGDKILDMGESGTWNDRHIWRPFPFRDTDGTWYIFCNAGISSGIEEVGVYKLQTQTALQVGKWLEDLRSGGSVTITSGEAVLADTNDDSGIASSIGGRVYDSPTKMILEPRVKITASPSASYAESILAGFIDVLPWDTASNLHVMWTTDEGTNRTVHQSRLGGSWGGEDSIDSIFRESVWLRPRVVKLSNIGMDWILYDDSGSQLGTAIMLSTDVPWNWQYPIAFAARGATLNIDWVKIRLYVSTEPTIAISAATTGQTIAAVTGYVTADSPNATPGPDWTITATKTYASAYAPIALIGAMVRAVKTVAAASAPIATPGPDWTITAVKASATARAPIVVVDIVVWAISTTATAYAPIASPQSDWTVPIVTTLATAYAPITDIRASHSVATAKSVATATSPIVTAQGGWTTQAVQTIATALSSEITLSLGLEVTAVKSIATAQSPITAIAYGWSVTAPRSIATAYTPIADVGSSQSVVAAKTSATTYAPVIAIGASHSIASVKMVATVYSPVVSVQSGWSTQAVKAGATARSPNITISAGQVIFAAKGVAATQSPTIAVSYGWTVSSIKMVATTYAPITDVEASQTVSAVKGVAVAYTPITDVSASQSVTAVKSVATAYASIAVIEAGSSLSAVKTIALAYAPTTSIFSGVVTTAVICVATAYTPITIVSSGWTIASTKTTATSYAPIADVSASQTINAVKTVVIAYAPVSEVGASQSIAVAKTTAVTRTPVAALEYGSSLTAVKTVATAGTPVVAVGASQTVIAVKSVTIAYSPIVTVGASQSVVAVKFVAAAYSPIAVITYGASLSATVAIATTYAPIATITGTITSTVEATEATATTYAPITSIQSGWSVATVKSTASTYTPAASVFAGITISAIKCSATTRAPITTVQSSWTIPSTKSIATTHAPIATVGASQSISGIKTAAIAYSPISTISCGYTVSSAGAVAIAQSPLATLQTGGTLSAVKTAATAYAPVTNVGGGAVVDGVRGVAIAQAPSADYTSSASLLMVTTLVTTYALIATITGELTEALDAAKCVAAAYIPIATISAGEQGEYTTVDVEYRAVTVAGAEF